MFKIFIYDMLVIKYLSDMMTNIWWRGKN